MLSSGIPFPKHNNINTLAIEFRITKDKANFKLNIENIQLEKPTSKRLNKRSNRQMINEDIHVLYIIIAQSLEEIY